MLRDLLPSEAVPELGPIPGEGFRLTLREVKIHRASGSPVALYGVFVPETAERVGIGSLILEPDPSQTPPEGNICASISSAHPDSTLLLRVADALLRYSLARGIATPQIVVPETAEAGIQVCEALAPTRRRPVQIDQRTHLAFEYQGE